MIKKVTLQGNKEVENTCIEWHQEDERAYVGFPPQTVDKSKSTLGSVQYMMIASLQTRVGESLGEALGAAVGSAVGPAVGPDVGPAVGPNVGPPVG